ncbi:unnamed protein product [Rotaria sp. Silwood2]|nr:unnamed protein product [Rotaria sp. Silwood2]CAF2783630.1 unnamed protein product [Rotaria sp. Silwood2]CAF3308763.1 unnamed protein product [Rotaria sp. Silwood2]CAF4170641.1 unnamed protein product [Rotaria sp. Silwood2]CAF4205040.1 unnamed protein product [Rotaria sp. Silwood2]
MIENLEPSVLVWLANSEDLFDVNYQKEFYKRIKCLVKFTDTDKCEHYIRKCCSNGTQVVLIIGKPFVFDFLRQIHDIRQVSSIYIISEDKKEPKINLRKIGNNFSHVMHTSK